MNAALPAAPRRADTLAAAPLDVIAAALRGRRGLRFDYGAVSLRLRSDSTDLATQLQAVYGHFALDTDGDAGDGGWADLHVEVMRQRGVRRWFAPQVTFRCDGREPFVPFPADSPLPLAEWGVNWLIGQRLNDLLLLHAGAVERDGLALILPAAPGSGKSTLTAALSLRGWRLLSDEFGAYDPALGAFRALLKPIALKNQSIDVVRAFEPGVRLGPAFPKTRKGTVAHLGADAHACANRAVTAAPGAVILPRWSAGSATRLEPIAPESLFPALAYNAFNYATLGAVGFDAAVRLARVCPGWTLVYSDLDDALATIDRCWGDVVARHAPAPQREPVPA